MIWNRPSQRTAASPSSMAAGRDVERGALDGCDGEGGVLGLVASEQRQARAIARRRRLDLDGLAVEAVPVGGAERHGGAGGGECRAHRLAAAGDDVHRVGALRRGDDGLRALDDAGLFARDVAQGRPEYGRVVEAEGRDDGDAGLEHVGCVEPPAEPDFENGDVDPLR